MAAQLSKLSKLGGFIGLDTVTLGIIPLGARTPFSPKHGFWIIDERLVAAEELADVRQFQVQPAGWSLLRPAMNSYVNGRFWLNRPDGSGLLTDPAVLLPAVRERLRPNGTLMFSQRPPVEGCYGCQASYIPRGDDEDPLVVKRWDYEPEVWERLLKDDGFTDVRVKLLAAPPGRRTVGTLIVRAGI